MKAIVEAYDSGDLESALKDGEAGFGKWLKKLGKEQRTKRESLFMPTRVHSRQHACETCAQNDLYFIMDLPLPR